ncbi:MAG: methyl-accepting chemotaxis protein [Nitrospiraceae bacterium]|nr:methyl-accepting chemotaxis protein [Nitrospiraceae bacterium]
MRRFANLATRTKLFIGFGLVFAILVAVIVTAYSGLTSIRVSQSDLYLKNFLPSLNLAEIISDRNQTRADIEEMMLTKDRTKQRTIERDIKDRADEIGKLIDAYSESLKSENDAGAMKKLDELISVRDEYRKTRDEQFALIRAGKIEDSRKLSVGIQSDRYNRILELALGLRDTEINRAKTRVADSESTARRLLLIFILAGATAFVLALLAVLALNKMISGPLKEIAGVADRMSKGDLAADISLEDRKDEVGMLSKAFGRMIAYLQEMAGMAKRIADNDLTIAAMPLSSRDILGSAFADMVANLKKMNREIQDSVNILATSAGEILSSTTEVASSVTETAASVNETTTTVEEVKQTAQVSTQKAKQVSEAAQRAVQVSQTGGKAVDDTIEKMNQIRLQMESIAGSIVRLSEQGQAIGEIIGAVNDLAEQSNLLAVNASIEAAKAGEHGKGFTVVAQEVRSLAEQSKQATAQVRAILNDIQKATSAAVLATEQGSKTVEEGVKQSGRAGEAIKALAGNIAEAAQAATQIAASSQQQLVGMEQVISAMNSVKLASEQNVTGTKQTEAAAHALNELGQKLKLLMAQYKL